MQAYTFQYPNTLVEGIEAVPKGVRLGRTTQRSREAWVGLDRYDPPLIERGRIYQAALFTLNKKGQSFILLREPEKPAPLRGKVEDPAGHFLVRVLCTGASYSNAWGRWERVGQGPRLITQANTGNAGDGLFIFHRGDALKVIPAQDRPIPGILACQATGLQVFTPEEWEEQRQRFRPESEPPSEG